VAYPAGRGEPGDQQRLRLEARRYEALLSAEGSIVWVIDPELRPTGRNEGWERYTGQTGDEYLQMGWLSAIHPDDRDLIRAQAAQAIAAGTPVSLEIRVRRFDGVYRRNLIRAMPIREGGSIIEWIGTATDVEDARQTADEQRDLRARLLALTEGAEALLSTRSQADARTGALELAQRVLPGDAYAIWWFEASRREWRVVHSIGLSEDYAAQRLPGEPFTLVEPLALVDVHRDEAAAARRPAYAAEGIRSMLAVPLPIGGERCASLVVYHHAPHAMTDTELRVATALGQLAAAALWNAETYEQLRRSGAVAERHAARMSFLADASATLASLDYEATLRQVAQLAVARVADWCAVHMEQPDGSLERIVTAHVDPAKVQLARTLAQRYPTDPAATFGVSNVLRTGRAEFYPDVTDQTLQGFARDPEHLTMLRAMDLHSVLLLPLTARGHTLGVITFIRTGEGQLSEDDVTVLTEVARRAGLAVDNARLYRDAERANRAKDEFLAILSHELRTPLNAIMGWSHMLREGLPEDMTRHAIEVIARNARSQKQLVEDLLDVARIASGRLELHRKPVDLRELGRVSVDSVLPSARAKDVTLSFETASHAVPVSGDSDRLQQVIANLLSNALKFTDPGGRVTVRVGREQDTAHVSVSDTGIGIPPEFLPFVFDRFRQADESLSRPYAGLGLGLWVVKQIVDGHGGRVRAESDGTGSGTTVTIMMPVV
jgi:PAS domain S-box-containing protein